jgi:hypothetical protein
MRIGLLVAGMVMAATLAMDRACAQARRSSDDPLRHGYALLIGNSHYKDPRWPQLEDIHLQLQQLEKGLSDHFDRVFVAEDLEAISLLARINTFFRQYGNDSNSRLFIYYAGHGFSEPQLNTYRGYITGIDTPSVDGAQGYKAARPKAISMAEIRAQLESTIANSVLFIFDSCFSGSFFTDRAGNDPPRPLTPDKVAQLLEKPARDIITAGRSNERVPAHSPIPSLLLAAINGEGDRYKHGVVSSTDIYAYLQDGVSRMREIKLNPQFGRLPNPDFTEGAFFFRVLGPAARPPDVNESKTKDETLALATELPDGEALRIANELFRLGIRPRPLDARMLAEVQKNLVAEHTPLGLELANMSADLRRRYKIKATVKGVIITGVDANSPAADERLSPGDVIMKIAEEAVASAGDVVAKIAKLKNEGGSAALLLVARADGKTRYVEVNFR